MQNVLQYEIWQETPRSLLKEAFQRIPLVGEDANNGNDWGMRIKTVFRIYDTDGKIATLVESIAHHDKVKWDIYTTSEKFSWFARICNRLTLRIAERRMRAQKERVLAYAHAYLRGVLARTSQQPVAVEPYSGPFRLMERAEIFELSERVANAKGLHIFVFAPNELCADRNDILTAALV